MSRAWTIHKSHVRMWGALQQSVSAFYGSFHTTVTRWAQFKINNTQSLAWLLRSIYLEIDAFSACLIQGIGHGDFLSIYTRIQEQYKQFGTLRAKGECPLSSGQAGYRKVLKSYFTCLTGNISQNVDSNPKPRHSSVLLCACLPMSPYKGADHVRHYQRT